MRHPIELEFASERQAGLRAAVHADREARIHRADSRKPDLPRILGLRLSPAR